MCGRYVLSSPGSVLREMFGLAETVELKPRYNIAPGQMVPIIREETPGRRELVKMRWGFVPAWAPDPSSGSRLINARAETVASKPSFRDAFRRRRCLVPADGYYEWRREGTRKQPYLFRLQELRPFAIAGLWSRWQPDPEAPTLLTCALVTTAANAVASAVHDRMPLVIEPRDYAAWLDRSTDLSRVLALLSPLPDSELVGFPVSTLVNSPNNDGPELIRPVA